MTRANGAVVWVHGQVTHDPSDDPEWHDVGSGEPASPEGIKAAARWAWANTFDGGRWRVIERTERCLVTGTGEQEPKL